jgi:DNA primase
MMQTWVDFAAIKRSVPLAPLLRRYQVKLRRSGRDQYRGCCPIHGGKSREAFHANLSKNVFHCFSCGAAGTVLDFVAAMDRCSLRAAALKLACSIAEPVVLPPAPACSQQLVTKKINSSSPLGFTLRGVDTDHPYLAARGIETPTAVRFGVGFYRGSGMFAGRLVIPIHNERGGLVAYCGRTIDGSQPRYRFPSGFAKSEFVFNLHRAAAAGQQTAVVVEGFFDCLKVHQAGVPAVVALMGSELYEPQKSALLRHFQSIILMLDGDTAGRRATAAITAKLRPHAPVRVIHLADGVQPDQLTPEAAREILQACSRQPGTIC